MKTIALVFSVLLAGCSFILPIPHDPAMYDGVIKVKVALDNTSCKDKNWNDLLSKVEHLKVYTQTRNDPQSKSVAELENALDKANTSKSEAFCESVVKISRVRVDTIIDAWKGR